MITLTISQFKEQVGITSFEAITEGVKNDGTVLKPFVSTSEGNFKMQADIDLKSPNLRFIYDDTNGQTIKDACFISNGNDTFKSMTF